MIYLPVLNFRNRVSRIATTANVEPTGCTLQKVVLINENNWFRRPFINLLVFFGFIFLKKRWFFTGLGTRVVCKTHLVSLLVLTLS